MVVVRPVRGSETIDVGLPRCNAPHGDGNVVCDRLPEVAIGRLLTPVAELAESYVHMHVNRLMRSSPREHELVLCDFLRRLYEAAWARSRTPESAEPPAP